MIQHVDEVARAMRGEEERCSYMHGGPVLSDWRMEKFARAAMRAVVKQMREPSEEMIWAGKLSASKFGDVREVFRAMLDAYAKEAGIDE